MLNAFPLPAVNARYRLDKSENKISGVASIIYLLACLKLLFMHKFIIYFSWLRYCNTYSSIISSENFVAKSLKLIPMLEFEFISFKKIPQKQNKSYSQQIYGK